jgi:hypothetical protein
MGSWYNKFYVGSNPTTKSADVSPQVLYLLSGALINKLYGMERNNKKTQDPFTKKIQIL